MSDARDFLLGFLLSTSLFLGTFASYIIFCPHAKTLQGPPVINQYITVPASPMLPPMRIMPKGHNNNNDA